VSDLGEIKRAERISLREGECERRKKEGKIRRVSEAWAITDENEMRGEKKGLMGQYGEEELEFITRWHLRSRMLERGETVGLDWRKESKSRI
jgi:hypothetical protein